MSYKPDAPNIYQGKQVIINSDRLIFNAKNDSILLFSDKAIGFSTNGSFHFDTSDKKDSKFIINSPNIYLGLKDTDLPTEPVLLGNQMKNWTIGNGDGMNDSDQDNLLDILDSILDMIESEIFYVSPILGLDVTPGNNRSTVKFRRDMISNLRKRFKENLSKQVKTI